MRNKAKTVAYMGLMLALVLVLSWVERLFPPLPMLPPGVNLGLSNIITMYCAFGGGIRRAFGIAVLKSAFVMFTRGLVAGFLSLSGGFLSLLVIAVLLVLFKRGISYIGTGICGAVAHNLGQIAAASLVLSTNVFFYTPALIVSGIVMGTVTGTAMGVLLPAFRRLFGSEWPG